MKFALFILSCILLVQTCNFQNTHLSTPVKSGTVLQQPTLIDFEKEIKPIFIKNCSPCHFPGGKMYHKLPFDKDTTILNHSTAILRRIKNDHENKLLNSFITQNKNGRPEGGHD